MLCTRTYTCGPLPVSAPGDRLPISVSPNPANEYLKINGDLSEWKVTDMTGKIILSGKPENRNETSIPVAALGEGIYLLEIKAEGRIANKKFVVSR